VFCFQPLQTDRATPHSNSRIMKCYQSNVCRISRAGIFLLERSWHSKTFPFFPTLGVRCGHVTGNKGLNFLNTTLASQLRAKRLVDSFRIRISFF
jgi:hypothetical protein